MPLARLHLADLECRHRVLERDRLLFERLGSLLEANAARACAERATPGLVTRLRDIRRHIEAAFAASDVARVLEHTEQFYDAMFDGAGKLVSLGVVKSLNARINRLRALTIATPGRSDESNREMNALLDAIERRDGEAAAQASRAHTKRTAELAQRVLAEQREQAIAGE